MYRDLLTDDDESPPAGREPGEVTTSALPKPQ